MDKNCKDLGFHLMGCTKNYILMRSGNSDTTSEVFLGMVLSSMTEIQKVLCAEVRYIDLERKTITLKRIHLGCENENKGSEENI